MVKIGLIGAGFMGGTHLSAYLQLQHSGKFKVTAIADVDRARAERFAGALGAAVFGSGRALLDAADVDTVDICLPTYMHYEYAVQAIEKGYNVFVEKPLCRTAREAAHLAALARERNVIAMVGQCIRFWDEYVYLKDCIDRNVYGTLQTVHLRRVSPRPNWGFEGWLTDPNRSGGAMLDLHIHDSDYLLHVFGEPKAIKTITNKTGEAHSYALTVCDYEGFTASIEGTWNLPHSYPFEMYYRAVFEHATVEFSSKSGVTVYTNEGTQTPVIQKACERSSENLGGNLSDLGGYYNELSYFIDCLSAGKPAQKADLTAGAQSVAFIEREIASKL